MTLLEITLLAALWANVSTMIVVWLCPRLFRHLPEDDALVIRGRVLR